MKTRLGLLASLALVAAAVVGCTPAETKAELPGAWGEGATYKAGECSITIDPSVTNPDAKPLKDFMNRDDVRYFDLRDHKEGYGVGHIAGFESVSWFNVICGAGEQLFYLDGETYKARYNESETILNDIFPKDKVIFGMCQVGGRVTPWCVLLSQYGYDMSKVYNVGGWNQLAKHEDHCGLEVSEGVAASAITYDFSTLTKKA